MYHGTEPLCQEKQSRQVLRMIRLFQDSTLAKANIGSLSSVFHVQVGPADPKWDEWLNMEINVLDIPRSAIIHILISFP